MRIAIIHEWLVTYSGSERVLEQILAVYPDADLFCVIDFLDNQNREFILRKKTTTTFIQHLPKARSKYRSYLPLMPLAIEQLDLSNYDLVISSNHAVAKGVLTGPDQLHISCIYSPIRYAWDLQHQYLKYAGLDGGVKGWLAKWILHKIRLWDSRTANGVDSFIAISHFIARRIKKVYRRESTVIYPPVDIHAFTQVDIKESFYLTASRLVPYKRIDLIVEAFSKMPDRRLVVIGDGKGHVGVGLGKANEVIAAITKSKENAKLSLQRVSVINGTIPHKIIGKYGASRVMLKPASPGTGIIAGAAVRPVMEQVGIHNILTKIIGSNNPLNVVKAVMNAFENLQDAVSVATKRGITVKEVFN